MTVEQWPPTVISAVKHLLRSLQSSSVFTAPIGAVHPGVSTSVWI